MSHHLNPYSNRHSVYRSNKKQRGQALIFGIFILVAVLAGLFFLFNTGRLFEEKTKLTNTADAVAYSAGIMHARTLNFEAYTNRAMVANTMTYAQMVSLSSWSKYVLDQDTWFPKFRLRRYDNVYNSVNRRSQIANAIRQLGIGSGGNDILEQGAKIADRVIHDVLMNAQQVAYEGVEPARTLVMDKVAKANYADDGDIEVDLIPVSTQTFHGFVSRYSDDKRTRFAEVTRNAVKTERFLDKRDWYGIPRPVRSQYCSYTFDFLQRDGGTKLVNFDSWYAHDVLYEWIWIYIPIVSACLPFRITLASGEQGASKQYSTIGNGGLGGGGLGAGSASSDSWNYMGLPSFYDLSEDMLRSDDPKLEFSVRVLRSIDQTRTSEGRSAIRNTPRLNDYHAQPAGGDKMAAIATSEVYFERPPSASTSMDAGRPGNNVWKNKQEIGSLFNPFWRVRLIRSDTHTIAAQARQGVILP